MKEGRRDNLRATRENSTSARERRRPMLSVSKRKPPASSRAANRTRSPAAFFGVQKHLYLATKSPDTYNIALLSVHPEVIIQQAETFPSRNNLRVVVATEVGSGAIELHTLASHAAVRAVRDQSLLSTSCRREGSVSHVSRGDHWIKI